MALLDRFRVQSRQKHADPAVRMAFVEEIPLDERGLLTEIAREDEDARVRRAAVSKLMDPAALASVAGMDRDEGVRHAALGMLRDIALDAFEGVVEEERVAAVGALVSAADAKTLALVAKTALREDVARAALAGVRDVHALGSVARHAVLEPIRLAACDALGDAAEIAEVALNSEFKDTGLWAVERLGSRTELEHVAARGRNKAAVKRARVRLRETDEQEAAEQAAQAARSAEAAAVLSPEERARQDAERREAEAAAALAAAARTEADAARARDEAAAADAARGRAELAEAERQRREAAAEQARAEAVERAARAAEAREREERARRDALARVRQLLARVEPLAGKTDVVLKVAERALGDVRAALEALPQLPTRQDRDDVQARLKGAAAALTPRVLELREAADWQRWANVGVQEQLCAKMEALGAVENPADIVGPVRELQQQWRQVADVPRGKGEVLWRRFKAAHDVAWAKCEAHFAAEAAVREANTAKKGELAQRAEALADSTNWIQTAEDIKRLQAEWKTVGPAGRGQEKALWDRFRAACDRFFTSRHAHLAERRKTWSENAAKKEALCARAEALAESTEWDAAASEIKGLQGEWRNVGPVKKSRSEPLWQRFRAACDRFFARYAGRHDLARAERAAAREAICAELESLAIPAPPAEAGEPPADGLPPAIPDEPPAGLLDRVHDIRRRWQQEIAARGVDRAQAVALDDRFAAAFATVLSQWTSAFAGSDLDLAANGRRMEALVRRMENLANSVEGRAEADAALSPATRMAAMLKEALAANTIGGKVDDGSRVRAAAEEAARAQAEWARIGPVAEAARRALADRFGRACRRISEKARPTVRS